MILKLTTKLPNNLRLVPALSPKGIYCDDELLLPNGRTTFSPVWQYSGNTASIVYPIDPNPLKKLKN
jgi:hypothetical protein